MESVNMSQSTTADNSPSSLDTDIPASASTDQAVEATAGAPKTRAPRACSFFAQGNCRFGNECRFSHDSAVVAKFIQYQSMNGRNPSLAYAPASSPKNNNHQEMAAPARTRTAGSPTSGAGAAEDRHGQQQYGGGYSVFIQAHPGLSYKTVNIPPGHPVFSIDVECVATGVQHNSRSVAQVSLVDEWCRPLYNAYIQQDKPVVSYLTELTGITKEILDTRGRPLAEVMVELRAFLSPQAVLVGQSIHKDVQWLQLAEGMDYHSMINLARLFSVYNPQRNSHTSFSQDHCATVWLGMPERPHHDALTDATISMSLFNMYRQLQMFPPQMVDMQQRTLNAPRIPGFSKRYPVLDGCCMGNRQSCNCGAPF